MNSFLDIPSRRPPASNLPYIPHDPIAHRLIYIGTTFLHPAPPRRLALNTELGVKRLPALAALADQLAVFVRRSQAVDALDDDNKQRRRVAAGVNSFGLALDVERRPGKVPGGHGLEEGNDEGERDD